MVTYACGSAVGGDADRPHARLPVLRRAILEIVDLAEGYGVGSQRHGDQKRRDPSKKQKIPQPTVVHGPFSPRRAADCQNGLFTSPSNYEPWHSGFVPTEMIPHHAAEIYQDIAWPKQYERAKGK